MYLKKISVIVVAVFVLLFAVQGSKVQAAITFTDVSSATPAYGEIMYLVNLGVLEGSFENGKRVFKPNEQVTRGQAAKMVVIATGQEPLVVDKSSFTDIDIKKNGALSGYVERAVQLGYFSEYSPGKFEPKIALSRNEMSKVLAKAFQLDVEQTANLTIPFTDVQKSDPYYPYIAAIYYNGITSGTHNSTKYSAKDPVTRAQFSSFVARASSDTYRLKLPVQGVSTTTKPKIIGKVYVDVDILNVRSTPSTANKNNIVGKEQKGKELSVYEDQGEWLKIAYNGKTAFVAKEYTIAQQTVEEVITEQETPAESGDTDTTDGEPQEVALEEATEETNEEATEEIIEQQPIEQVEQPVAEPSYTIGLVTVAELTLHEKNAKASTALAKLKRGTQVDVLSFKGSWLEVSYNGTIGFVEKQYIRLKNTEASAVANRIIVLDPGHGGKDPGALGGPYMEKAIVLKVANLVKEKLEADGATVKMTRTGDTFPTLEERIQFTKDVYGELFVSIHTNSFSTGKPNGTETYYSVTSNENEKEDVVLATNINNLIVKNAGMTNRGVKRSDYKVIANLKIPAVLVELGFISNSADRAKLVSDKYVEIFADAIYQGIVDYYAR